MATSKDVYRLDSMSVAATASVTLTGWKTSAGGTRNAVASVNVSQSFNSGQSFGTVSVGGVAVPYFALVTPDYKDATTGASVSLSNPPILYVCSTNNKDTTSDKAFANNTTSVRIVISRSSDGSGGTASASGSGSVSYESTKLYTETTYTRTVARANVGSKNCGKVEPTIVGKVVFHDGTYYSGSDYTAKATAFVDSAVSPNLPGYFIEWTGDVEEEGVTVDPYTYQGGQLHALKTVAKDLSFTAHFAPKLALVYAKNDGSGETIVHPFPKATQWSLPANTFTRDGYTFAGWRKDNPTSGDEYADEAQAEFSANCTLYAQWELIEGHSLVADAKCGQTALGVQVSVSPAENAIGGGWVEGTQMTATAPTVIEDAAGNVQYVFVAWTASANVVLPSPATDAEVEFDMPDSDATLTANYALKPLNVAAEVDSGSVGKVTASLVVTRVVDGQTVTVRGTSEDPFRYGDTATFTATVATGYSFGGWYATGSDNTPRFSMLQYSMMLKEDTVLVAKASVRVEFSWPDATPYVSHGPLSINGERFQNGLASAVLAIGSTAEIKAELTSGEFTGFSVDGESKDFTRWSEGVYVANITVPDAPTPPTPLPQDYVAIVSVVAGWSATIETYYVALYAQNGNATPAEFSEDGAFSLTGNGVEEIVGTTEPAKTAAEVYEDLMRAKYGDENFEALSDLGRFFKVTGAQNVVIGVYAVGNRPLKDFDRWEKYEPPQQSEGGEQDDEEQESEETDYGLPPAGAAPDAEYPKSIDGDYIGVATFKIGDTYTVRIEHEAPDSATIAQGSLDMGGFTSIQYASDRYWLEGTFKENTTATVTARPANGYKFKCWKENGSVLAGWGAQHSFVPSQNRILVAEFEEDSVGILLWEGSDENMEMEWTSKVYVTPKPFDPVAARIDATGYPEPVQLSVGTFSSPNVAPGAAHKEPITVVSQDGRRLPRMRPERFVRFTVKASCEIDAVVIGTNMAEVN